jgi:hypothetical protein
MTREQKTHVVEALRETAPEVVYGLGERALYFYLDTGCCVFCGANDATGTPHEGCDVGLACGES